MCLSSVPYCIFGDTQAHQAVKGIVDSYDVLADLLESIEHFLHRLDIYTKIPPTVGMTEMIVKILVELLSTLAVVTKQIKQGKSSESVFGEILLYHIIRLNSTQKILLRNFSERRRSRQYSRGWIGSPRVRLR